MRNSQLPNVGRSWPELRETMTRTRSEDLPWYAERSFKPAYFAGEDVLAVANDAYQMYITDNALYSHSAFPSLQSYEDDVVAMVLELLNGSVEAGGTLSSGGTESNFMAVKTARDWARQNKSCAVHPNMVVPRTAHPSFEKAAHMLGVELRRAAESPSFVADVPGMSALIDQNTIMVVASAPPYPYGETDPVEAIANVALENELWLHVDGCLGGFILPFAREFDDNIPSFDFSIDGVTSMSADIHKYGYAAKGISALLLQNAELERYQRSSFDDWPSGLYSTAHVSGSRSGGALASAWAVMHYLGREGYRQIVKRHLDVRDSFIDAINSVTGLHVIAHPHAYNFAFTSSELDIFAVADGMIDRGWTLARSNEPASIQLMINLIHEQVVPSFHAELEEVVTRVRDGSIVARSDEAIYAV